MKILSAAVAVILSLAVLNGTSTQLEKPKGMYANRYGHEYNERLYSQKMPKDTMTSIVKVLSDERFDYLMAQLADPAYIDAKVALYKQDYAGANEQGKTLLAFQRLVRETTKFYFEDAEIIQELRRFAKNAEWKVTEDLAIGTVKELAGRQVILRKLEGRWFLKNRQDLDPEPPPEK